MAGASAGGPEAASGGILLGDVMIDDSDGFDDDFSDGEGTPRRNIGICTRVPEPNSVSFRLTAMLYAEVLLQQEIPFLESEPGEPAAVMTPQPQQPQPETALGLARKRISDYWNIRIALARSLGTNAEEEDYKAACKREGITP